MQDIAATVIHLPIQKQKKLLSPDNDTINLWFYKNKVHYCEVPNYPVILRYIVIIKLITRDLKKTILIMTGEVMKAMCFSHDPSGLP